MKMLLAHCHQNNRDTKRYEWHTVRGTKDDAQAVNRRCENAKRNGEYTGSTERKTFEDVAKPFIDDRKANNRVDQSFNQFSTRNPATRANSLSLSETSVRSRVTACAAMMRSLPPMGVPANSSCVRIDPWISSAGESKGSVSIAASTASSCAVSRGEAFLAAPYRNSAATTMLVQIFCSPTILIRSAAGRPQNPGLASEELLEFEGHAPRSEHRVRHPSQCLARTQPDDRET
jgi:hypothetical protein